MPHQSSHNLPAAETRVVDYHDYVDEQIRRTTYAVKAADVCSAVLRLVVMVLLLLAAAAGLEHWVFRGGFSTPVRYGLFASLLAAVGWWCFRELWPLVTRAINPVYAAQTIEQASPSLKNSLVNLLLFRSHEKEMPPAVYKALQQQAAEKLAGVAGDEPVDRRGLIRLGYVLVGLLAIGALYTLLSPKNPLLTAARVLMPWADIAAPTRVQITEVAPGTTEAARGAKIPVTAMISGLKKDEQPELVVLSGAGLDGQRRIPLTTSSSEPSSVAGASAAAAEPFGVDWLPEDAGAFGAVVADDRPLRWRIEAGDARSPTYRLTLRTAPAIVVRRVHFDYPEYTGYFDHTVEGVGDIRAIEGTKVTVVAEANTSIDTAQVDFGGDGRPDVRMKSEGAGAEASWTLALRSDRRTPRHPSYVLRYMTPEGRENEDPASYKIDVYGDIAPEASITFPSEPTRDVRLNETVVIRVEARDPDFGLDSVKLHGDSLGARVFEALLLAKPEKGQFIGQWRFTPAEHGLREGDLVDYWVTASDVRRPQPLQTDSPRQRFRIVSPKPGEVDPDKGLAERNQEGQRGENGQQGDQQQEGGEGQPGAQGAEGGNEQDGGQEGSEAQQDGGQGESGETDAGQQSGDDRGGAQNQENQDQDGQGEAGPEGGLTSNDSSAGGEGESESKSGGQSAQPQGEGDSNTSQQGSGSTSQDNPGDSNKQSGEGGGGQPADGKQTGDSGDENPVSPEGDDDGTAFDRIRKHMEEQQRERSQNEENQRGDQPAGDKPSGEDKSGEGTQQDNPGEGNSKPGAEGEPQGDGDQPGESNPQNGANPGEEGAEPSKGSKPAAGEQPERNGEQTGGDPENNVQSREASESTSSGSGEEVGEQETAEGNKKPREGTGSQGKNEAADQGTGTSGDRGAGESTNEGGDKEPAGDHGGDPSQGNRPGEGQQRREGQGEKPGGAPAEQTDDEGSGGPQESGDRQGESEQGDPSQDANQPQGDSQDRGDGQQRGEGQERGDGQTDGATGDESGQPSAGAPPSDQQGEPGQESGQSDEQPGQSGDSEPGEGPSRESTPENGKPSNSSHHGEPQGGGGNTAGEHQGGEPGGDEANLEFARKQTDLLLESLEEQLKRKQVDQELLDSLGWSEDDLRKFVSRWQDRKQAAQERGGAAEAELDEALRQLGMKPGRLGTARSRTKDTQRDNRSGYRGTVPTKYRDRLRRYSEGVSRGK